MGARLQRLQTHVRSTRRRWPPTSKSQLLSRPQLVSHPAAPSSTPAARRHLTKSQRSSTSTLGWLSISKATLTPRRDHIAKNWWTAVLKAPRSTWLPRVARTRLLTSQAHARKRGPSQSVHRTPSLLQQSFPRDAK